MRCRNSSRSERVASKTVNRGKTRLPRWRDQIGIQKWCERHSCNDEAGNRVSKHEVTHTSVTINLWLSTSRKAGMALVPISRRNEQNQKVSKVGGFLGKRHLVTCVTSGSWEMLRRTMKWGCRTPSGVEKVVVEWMCHLLQWQQWSSKDVQAAGLRWYGRKARGVIGNPLPQNGAGGRMLSQVVLESAQPSVQQARKSG